MGTDEREAKDGMPMTATEALNDLKRVRTQVFLRKLFTLAKRYMRAVPIDGPGDLPEHKIIVEIPASPEHAINLDDMLKSEADLLALLTLPEGFVVVRKSVLEALVNVAPLAIIEDGARHLEAVCAYKRRDWKFADKL